MNYSRPSSKRTASIAQKPRRKKNIHHQKHKDYSISKEFEEHYKYYTDVLHKFQLSRYYDPTIKRISQVVTEPVKVFKPPKAMNEIASGPIKVQNTK